jgi:hypothetical protein
MVRQYFEDEAYSYAKGGGVKIKSKFRIYNSPVIKTANFNDGSHINLMRLIKPYKNGEKYGISKISINKIGDEVRIFKTLEDAESYFDRIVNQKKKSVDLREEVGTTNNYGKGGILGTDARLEYVTDAFASGSLMEELKEKLGIETDSLGDNYVISFAYTDYGGDFMDKVAIAYFKENYPDNTLVENAGYNGENAYVFGEPAKEWIETTQDYPLGFEDIEDFYYEKTSEQENEDFNYFLDEIKGDYSFDKDEALQWLNENRGGYFGMTTQGLDFSFEDLTNDLVNEGVIEPNEEDEDFANGGGVEDRYILKDVEEDETTEFSAEELKEYISDWNNSMETDYEDWKDFNRGEEYYKITPLSRNKKSSKVQETYILKDVEEDETTEFSVEELKEYIADWNNSMETDYEDWKDFNKGEEYYKITPISKHAKGGDVRKQEYLDKVANYLLENS